MAESVPQRSIAVRLVGCRREGGCVDAIPMTQTGVIRRSGPRRRVDGVF